MVVRPGAPTPLAEALVDDYLSLTTLASRHAALVADPIDDIGAERAMRDPPPPPGARAASTGVVDGWRTRVHGLAWYTAQDFPDGPERDRLIAARHQLVKALVDCLRTRYAVRREDSDANDLLCSLYVALSDIYESGAKSKLDLRVGLHRHGHW